LTLRRYARPLRGFWFGVVAACLVAGVLVGVIGGQSGRASAGTRGAYGVYVSTFDSEQELALGNFGAGSSKVISGLAVTDIGINSTATIGVATTYTDYRGGGAVTIYSVPAGNIIGTISGVVPVGYAMDPVNPSVVYAVDDSGTVYALNLASATSAIVANLNPTGASFTATSIGVAPDGGTVYVGGIINSFGFVDAVTVSSKTVTTWEGGMRDYEVVDLAVAPDGSALYGTSFASGFTPPSRLFRLALPFNPKSLATWADPSANSPIAVAFARSLTVDRRGQTVYLAGLNANGQSVVQAVAASTGAPGAAATVPLNSSSNGNGGFNGGVTSIALSPDGGTLLAIGGNVNASGSVSTLLYPISRAGLVVGARSGALGNSTPIGPRDVVVTPDQAPLAGITPASASAGTPMTLDASASSVAYGNITNYAWNFGDGSPIVNSGAPTVTHSYATQGTYKVTVTETDSAGTSIPPAPFVSSAVNGPGTTPYLNASATATVSEMVPVSKHGTPPPPPPPPTTTTVKRGTTTTTTLPGTPIITLTPTVGAPGTIVTITGTRFPANHSVTVSWSTNTGSYTEMTDAHGNLPAHEIFVLIPDVLGPRFATATSGGSTPVAKGPFLVVPGDGEPGGNSASVFFRAESQ
jgi:hypothetical protein